ncbi:MAG: hypothetical protein ACYDB6_11870, partial [Candidatus Limnocylindrales bacterium]
MFAAWITFSAARTDEETAIQIEVLLRANDPLYEVTMGLFGHRQEDAFWKATLANLASRFGVTAEATLSRTLVDSRRQWRNARNIVHNAAIRTGIYKTTHPWILLRRADETSSHDA